MFLEEIRRRIQEALPDAYVNVLDPLGSGDHFQVTVISTRFVGMPLIRRHRVIMELFREDFQGSLHALEIHALTPEEYERRVPHG
jgi:stress-induced morphogen